MKARFSPNFALLLVPALAVAACGGDQQSGDVGTGQPVAAEDTSISATPPPSRVAGDTQQGAPFKMSYKVVGTPIVGSPVTVNIRVTSTLGAQPIRITYGINDASALRFHEAQPSEIEVAPANNEDFVLQQVTVVPQREGRLFLNLGAAVETREGAMSTAMAIPIQVGSGGSPAEQGDGAGDESGEEGGVQTGD